MSEQNGLCLGCFRTMDEIRAWWDMQPVQREQVMDSLAQRQVDSASFD